MIKHFFEYNKERKILTIILLIILLFLISKLTSTGLPNIIIPIVLLLGFPIVWINQLGLGSPIEVIKEIFSTETLGFPDLILYLVVMLIILVIELVILYPISCILVKIFIFIHKLLKRWNIKKRTQLVIVILLLAGIYITTSFCWSDILTPTADDAGATTEGINAVVRANNQFAIELYKEISDSSNENILFSPWSISNAVVILYEGTQGETADEIEKIFHFPTKADLRRASYAGMLNNLNKARCKYKFQMANALWLQNNYPFSREYKYVLNKYYLTEIKNLDFINNPNSASSYINKWVSKRTNNKIRRVVSPNMFNELTRAVITNAIYFKGNWEHKFDKKDTKLMDFTLETGEKIEVPTMCLEDDELYFNYTESDGVQILEMPYKGGKISMLILLPMGNIKQLESIISTEEIQKWRNNLKPEKVFIYLPKFKFETFYSLTDYLKRMGIKTLFSPTGGNFSMIDETTEPLYISDILHKAFIDVNEKGTEATALTLGYVIGAAMPDYIEFRADHPFIFLIQERKTGVILFIGKVVNPKKSK